MRQALITMLEMQHRMNTHVHETWVRQFEEEDGPEQVADRILAQLEGYQPSGAGVLEATEALALHALETQSFSAACFWDLMAAVELDFEGLYRAYVSKNVLNFFRQDHGYKEGHYIKTWNGREDNEHLVELSRELDSGADDYADELYEALGRRYAECTG